MMLLQEGGMTGRGEGVCGCVCVCVCKGARDSHWKLMSETNNVIKALALLTIML